MLSFSTSVVRSQANLIPAPYYLFSFKRYTFVFVISVVDSVENRLSACVYGDAGLVTVPWTVRAEGAPMFDKRPRTGQAYPLCRRRAIFSTGLSKVRQQVRRETPAGALTSELQARCDDLDEIVELAVVAVMQESLDLVEAVHHSAVVAAAETVADLGERGLGE